MYESLYWFCGIYFYYGGFLLAMAVCLDYQSVYYRDRELTATWRIQLAVAALLLAAIIGKVYMQIEERRLAYDLGREKQLTVRLNMERRELELHRSFAYSSENIQRLAQARLQMVDLSSNFARKLRY